MDLASLDNREAQESGLDVDIVHFATAEPLGLTITIAGPDSERQRKARQKVQDARIQSRRIARLSVQEIREEGVQVLAESTLGWVFGKDSQGEDCTINGQKPEFSVEAAVSLYRKYPFIYEQVELRAVDRGAFTKP